jgi:GrpB-like predicted nucleotidyltransferase (UPF0157 family)
MALTSKITDYDARWPSMFLSERNRIAPCFNSQLIEIYHVGSTAVPGLAAKPEIDIMVEVSKLQDEILRDTRLQALGYIRRTNLSDRHHFYRRDVDGVRTHKLHVCHRGHSEIGRLLRFRDLLRSDPVLRQEYQQLKLDLEATNRDGMSEYLARKAPFINALVGPPLA